MRRMPARRKRPTATPISYRMTIPAPYMGLNARDPEALMKPGYATTMENWFPTGLQVELRPGATDHVTGFAAAVKSLLIWDGADGTSKLFACTNAGIYDATTAGAVGASVSTITSGRCQFTQYRTSGKSWLVVVNGVDDFRTYDGTSWATTATFAKSGGGTLTSNTIVNVAAHQRRLWFVIKDSVDPYYLNTDSIAAPVFTFPLGPHFTKGGSLLSIATWTVDGGNGPDDYCAFISSKGQVIVYAGTDPATASTWVLKGTYDIPEPIGYNCALKFGGDCLVLTRSGIFPLTELLKGKANDPSLAISDLITPLMGDAATDHATKKGWQMATLLNERLLLLNVPTVEDSESYQFAMNTTTRGWTKFTGWNALCVVAHKNGLYIGMTTKVAHIWNGRNDFNAAITATARGHFDYFNNRSAIKEWKGVIPVIKAEGAVSISIALDVDFQSSTAYGAASFISGGTSRFDSATYDASVWGEVLVLADLQTPAAYPGVCAALRLRAITSNSTITWSATDFIYEYGALFG